MVEHIIPLVSLFKSILAQPSMNHCVIHSERRRSPLSKRFLYSPFGFLSISCMRARRRRCSEVGPANKGFATEAQDVLPLPPQPPTTPCISSANSFWRTNRVSLKCIRRSFSLLRIIRRDVRAKLVLRERLFLAHRLGRKKLRRINGERKACGEREREGGREMERE